MKLWSLVLHGFLAALLAASTRASLINLSVMGQGGRDNPPIVVGFQIAGNGTKQTLIRGIGPGLNAFLNDGGTLFPSLALYNGSAAGIGQNSKWGGSSELSAVFVRVGAFALAPDSNDDVLLETLPPGSYSAYLTGIYVSGAILAEIYDADVNSGAQPTARLVNLSAFGITSDGATALTAGFVVAGGPERLLLRGIGPGLLAFNVTATGTRPILQATLTLHDAQGTVLATNSAWGGDSMLVDAFAQAGAFPLAKDSLDSAIVVTLPPGAYSIQVSGRGSQGLLGRAMAEIYELPQ